MSDPDTQADSTTGAGRPVRASVDAGLFVRQRAGSGVGMVGLLAAALAAGWVLAVLFVLPDSGGWAGRVITIAVPVAMIAVAAFAWRTAQEMRQEVTRLQAAIDSMRNAFVAQAQGGARFASTAARNEAARWGGAQHGTRQLKPQIDPATPVEPPTDAEPGEQNSLPLGVQDADIGGTVAAADIIRALDFPNDSDDAEGFAALGRALNERVLGKLVRAAQDMLTLLSQDGIYMDDLTAEPAPPEIWRRFARGERGAAIARIGGVRDRAALALAAGRMRKDPVFRDAAHHFLRQFDRGLGSFEKTVGDPELVGLAGTRTARAFMLLGRAAGTFD